MFFKTTILFGMTGVILMCSGLAAQTVLSQLGLTEGAARNFLMNEIQSPTLDRRGDIVQAGRRAFLKLPRSARGPAATALFAWAKAYVDSAPFKTAYAAFRRDVMGPDERPAQPSIDAEVQRLIDEQRAGFAQLRQAAAAMPPADAANILKVIEEHEANIKSGELARMLRTGIEAERADANAREAESFKRDNEQYPADPHILLERRLREFLDATADVDFAARTISLTGGLDGIEFIDKGDRLKPWIWQEAVIAGPEATAAARAAAQAWLKEIAR